jgi:hypothetical protein
MFHSSTLYKILSTRCKCHFLLSLHSLFQMYYYFYCFQQLCLLTTTICISVTPQYKYKLLFLKFQLFYLLFVTCTSTYFIIIILFNHHLHVTLTQKKPPQSHNIHHSKMFIHQLNTTQIALFILLNSLLHCMRRFSNVFVCCCFKIKT